MFCAATAVATSVAEMPSAVMRSGFSQTRIEYLEAPKALASPTPGTREMESTMPVVTKLVISSASRLSSGE